MLLYIFLRLRIFLAPVLTRCSILCACPRSRSALRHSSCRVSFARRRAKDLIIRKALSTALPVLSPQPRRTWLGTLFSRRLRLPATGPALDKHLDGADRLSRRGGAARTYDVMIAGRVAHNLSWSWTAWRDVGMVSVRLDPADVPQIYHTASPHHARSLGRFGILIRGCR
jgi:hypothetical protein